MMAVFDDNDGHCRFGLNLRLDTEYRSSQSNWVVSPFKPQTFKLSLVVCLHLTSPIFQEIKFPLGKKKNPPNLIHFTYDLANLILTIPKNFCTAKRKKLIFLIGISTFKLDLFSQAHKCILMPSRCQSWVWKIRLKTCLVINPGVGMGLPCFSE